MQSEGTNNYGQEFNDVGDEFFIPSGANNSSGSSSNERSSYKNKSIENAANQTEGVTEELSGIPGGSEIQTATASASSTAGAAESAAAASGVAGAGAAGAAGVTVAAAAAVIAVATGIVGAIASLFTVDNVDIVKDRYENCITYEFDVEYKQSGVLYARLAGEKETYENSHELFIDDEEWMRDHEWEFNQEEYERNKELYEEENKNLENQEEERVYSLHIEDAFWNLMPDTYVFTIFYLDEDEKETIYYS